MIAKMTQLGAMPSASVTTMAAAKPGVRRNDRAAARRSESMANI